MHELYCSWKIVPACLRKILSALFKYAKSDAHLLMQFVDRNLFGIPKNFGIRDHSHIYQLSLKLTLDRCR